MLGLDLTLLGVFALDVVHQGCLRGELPLACDTLEDWLDLIGGKVVHSLLLHRTTSLAIVELGVPGLLHLIPLVIAAVGPIATSSSSTASSSKTTSATATVLLLFPAVAASVEVVVIALLVVLLLVATTSAIILLLRLISSLLLWRLLVLGPHVLVKVVRTVHCLWLLMLVIVVVGGLWRL